MAGPGGSERALPTKRVCGRSRAFPPVDRLQTSEGGGAWTMKLNHRGTVAMLVPAGGALVAGCGPTGANSGGPTARRTTTPTPQPSAAQILTKPAMSTMKDMHFTATIQATSGGQTTVLTCESDMVRPSSCISCQGPRNVRWASTPDPAICRRLPVAVPPCACAGRGIFRCREGRERAPHGGTAELHFRTRLRRIASSPGRWRMAAPGSCCPTRGPGLPRASASPSCLTGIR